MPFLSAAAAALFGEWRRRVAVKEAERHSSKSRKVKQEDKSGEKREFWIEDAIRIRDEIRTELSEEIKALRLEVSEYRSENAVLKANLARADEKFEELVTDHDNQMADVLKKYNGLHAEYEGLKNEHSVLKEAHNTLKSKMERWRQRLEKANLSTNGGD